MNTGSVAEEQRLVCSLEKQKQSKFSQSVQLAKTIFETSLGEVCGKRVAMKILPVVLDTNRPNNDDD